MTIQVHGRVINSQATKHGVKFILDIEDGYIVYYDCAVAHPRADVRNLANKRLADLLKGCGVWTIMDSDELHGAEFDCHIEHDDIRGFIAKPPRIEPIKRQSWLRRLGRDWIRAPLSGTVVILAPVAAVVSFWRGDIALGLICLTYGEVVSMRRGPFNGGDNA